MADEDLKSAAPDAAPAARPAAGAARRASWALPAHLFGALFVVVMAAMTLSSMTPPAAVPASAGTEVFSAERAMAHVREIAKKPHPVGSPGHDLVRDYLFARLRELGLEPELQTTHVTHKFFGRIAGARVENVIARVPGKSGDKRALLFAAHYDAVPQSPGAGDDGSGTAALLESARAIVQGPPLDRDVVFLFSDGEELGLLGAGAFVAEHPAAKDVVAAFNFDARGSFGSVAMFDTSERSGALLATLSHVPRVQASSFVTALAKLLPNDTDATIFKKASIPTMSFAFADGVINYHRATDSVDRLDPRSVQQMGDSIVALARHLGRGTLPSLDADDVAYFTLFGRNLVRASHGAVIGSALVILALMIAIGGFAVQRRGVRPKAILAAEGAALGAIVASALAAAAINYGLHRSVSIDALLVRSGGIAIISVAAAAIVVTIALRLIARYVGPVAALLGACSFLATVAAILAVFVTGASIPFVAAAAAAAAVALASLFGDVPARAASYVAIGLVTLIAIPTLYACTVAAAAGAALPVGVLSVPFLLIAAPFALAAVGRRLLAALGGSLALAALGLVQIAWPLGDVPARSTLVYGVDADRKQGFYFGSEPQPWMAAALRRETAARRTVPELTLTDNEYWLGAPEVAGLGGVTVERAERRRLSDRFEVHVVLRAAPETRCIMLWDESKRVVDAVSVKGKPVRHLVRFSPERDEALMRRLRLGNVRPAFSFQYCGMRDEPLEIVLETRDENEIPVRLVEVRDGIPPVGNANLERSPGEIPTDDSDRTLVGKTVKF